MTLGRRVALFRTLPSLLRGQRISRIHHATSRGCCWFQCGTRHFGTRQEFEDEHHLGRALSRFDLEPAKQKRWAQKMRKKAQPWNVQPFELYPSAQYETEALRQVHQLSYSANVLLEIRDVRLPASTHNPSFTRLAKHRLHLICYTHADLIDSATRDRVEDWTEWSWPDSRSIFVDSREHRSDLHFDLMYDSLMGHLESAGGTNAALTVGVANTGKSSLLMCLLRSARQRALVPKKGIKSSVSIFRKKGKKRKMRKQAAPGIQDTPGKTREITEYLLREKPRTFFLDVPGMTPPPFFFEERPEAWFGYVAANLMPLSKNLKKDVDAQTTFCEYVLRCLNRDGNFGYVLKLGMDEPTDDISQVLSHVARGRQHKDEDKLRLRQCQSFLKLFNTGNFGPVVLDDLRNKYQPFVFKESHFSRNRR